MVSPSSPDFAAHKPTTAEVDGEIMPSYEVGTPNAPIYPTGAERDRDISHDRTEPPVNEAAPMPDSLREWKEQHPSVGTRNRAGDTAIYLARKGHFK